MSNLGCSKCGSISNPIEVHWDTKYICNPCRKNIERHERMYKMLEGTVEDIHRFAESIMDEAQQGRMLPVEYQLGRDLQLAIEIYRRTKREDP